MFHPFRFSMHTSYIFLISDVCNMPHSYHPPLSDNSSNNWQTVRITMLLIMQFPTASSYFSLLGPNILLNILFTNSINLCSSLNARSQVLHLNKSSSKNYVGYSQSKYRPHISLAHPRDCHFAHVQWLPLATEKLQMPFCEIRVMLMFVPVC